MNNNNNVISLEDYNTDYKPYIDACITFTGLEDLKYIYNEYLTYNENNIVGIYKKDFKMVKTPYGCYSLLLQKSGNYQLMENIYIKLNNKNMFIGIIMQGSNITLDFNNKKHETYNTNAKGFVCNILMYNAKACNIYNAILYSNYQYKIYSKYCQDCIFKNSRFNSFHPSNVLIYTYNESHKDIVDEMIDSIISTINKIE